MIVYLLWVFRRSLIQLATNQLRGVLPWIHVAGLIMSSVLESFRIADWIQSNAKYIYQWENFCTLAGTFASNDKRQKNLNQPRIAMATS